jgi:hypothetical protein
MALNLRFSASRFSLASFSASVSAGSPSVSLLMSTVELLLLERLLGLGLLLRVFFFFFFRLGSLLSELCSEELLVSRVLFFLFCLSASLLDRFLLFLPPVPFFLFVLQQKK